MCYQYLLFLVKKILTTIRIFLLTILGKKLALYRKYSSPKHIDQNSSARSHARFNIPLRKKKPDWVAKEVIKIKVYLPKAGCRYIADVFNQKFYNLESVSKSFVAYTIKNHLYEIQILRRKVKSRPAYNIPFNKVWGIDLTFINQQAILGVVEHHSRKNLTLKPLKNKTSISLLQALLDILEHYPKPEFIRSDNEICFNSKLFIFGLWILGIKKQTIPKHSPWCNGRVERFFGTLKTSIKNIPNIQTEELPLLMHNFAWWYNNIRLHQNLNGKTPDKIYQQQLRKFYQKE